MKNDNSTKNNILFVPKLEPFEVIITKCKIHVNISKGDYPAHIHDHFEIFVNVKGSTDFIVNNKIYHLSDGDILFIRPNVYHHTIYTHNCDHEYYFVFFPSTTNNTLINLLLPDDLSQDALIRMNDHNDSKKSLDLCEKMLLDRGRENSFQFLHFLEFLKHIRSSKNAPAENSNMEIASEPLTEILTYISDNYNTITSIKSISDHFHISLKTLERLFKKYVGNSPKTYLDTLRLSKASEFLHAGCNVTETAYKCGFCSTSNFISLFKSQFGDTPHKYKNKFSNSINNTYLLNNNLNKFSGKVIKE